MFKKKYYVVFYYQIGEQRDIGITTCDVYGKLTASKIIEIEKEIFCQIKNVDRVVVINFQKIS